MLSIFFHKYLVTKNNESTPIYTWKLSRLQPGRNFFITNYVIITYQLNISNSPANEMYTFSRIQGFPLKIPLRFLLFTVSVAGVDCKVSFMLIDHVVVDHSGSFFVLPITRVAFPVLFLSKYSPCMRNFRASPDVV